MAFGCFSCPSSSCTSASAAVPLAVQSEPASSFISMKAPELDQTRDPASVALACHQWRLTATEQRNPVGIERFRTRLLPLCIYQVPSRLVCRLASNESRVGDRYRASFRATTTSRRGGRTLWGRSETDEVALALCPDPEVARRASASSYLVPLTTPLSSVVLITFRVEIEIGCR
jgi:hypothetical protein